MDRRDFIKASLIGAAGVAVGPEILAQEMSAGVIVPAADTPQVRRPPGLLINGELAY